MDPSQDTSVEKYPADPRESDLIGEWFELLDKAYGARVLFEMGRIAGNAAEPEWYCFNHRHFDGIGALMTLMERQGMVIDGYPFLKESRIPGGIGRRLIELRSVLQDRRLRRRYGSNPWKVFHEHVGNEPCGATWFILSRQETAELRNLARKEGASLNTFLLWTLSRTIPRGLVGNPRAPLLWRVPVNMRGPLVLGNVRFNHVGSLFLEIPEDLSIATLHQKIRNQLKKNVHWMGILKLKEAKAKTKLTEATIVTSKRFIGIGWLSGRYGTGLFTNIGDWPGTYAHYPNGAKDDTRAWVVVTPASAGAPISVGCLTWNGRLSLTVNFAPGLVSREEDARRLTGLWLYEILGHLALENPLSGKAYPHGRVYFNARQVIRAGTVVVPPEGLGQAKSMGLNSKCGRISI